MLNWLPSTLIVILDARPMARKWEIFEDIVDSTLQISDEIEAWWVKRWFCLLLEYLASKLYLISVDRVHFKDWQYHYYRIPKPTYKRNRFCYLLKWTLNHLLLAWLTENNVSINLVLECVGLSCCFSLCINTSLDFIRFPWHYWTICFNLIFRKVNTGSEPYC